MNAEGTSTLTRPRESLFGDTWRRLKRNRLAMVGLVIIVLLFLIAIFAEPLAPYDPIKQNLRESHVPPGSQHLLGTDIHGRDILSRLIYGTRISLLVGFLPQFLSLSLAILLGLLSGYHGGWIDDLIMRLADAFFAFPSLLFMMALMFVMSPKQGLLGIVLGLGIVGWAGRARIMRGQVLSIKERTYIDAAEAIGAPTSRIIFRHVLPNCVAPLIIITTMAIPGAIMAEAGLSFIGLGVPPPTPSWGQMLYTGRAYIRQFPWLCIWPGLAILVTVLSFNLFGDGLRDALDPYLKK
ncbi:MAG: ABC transporter permease [Anaerolineae bacterium]|jgi:ABC-type dipeptide/oligopeptide/nickel transport system permease subunit